MPELFNLVDKFQCPGIVLSDLLLSEGRSSVDPAELDFNVPIDRGEVIGLNGATPPAQWRLQTLSDHRQRHLAAGAAGHAGLRACRRHR